MEEIDWSCPNDLKPYEDAHCMERDEKDIMQWQMGQYMAMAISCAFTKAKYPAEALFQSKKATQASKNPESREEVAVFEMSQRINLLRKQGLPESPI